MERQKPENGDIRAAAPIVEVDNNPDFIPFEVICDAQILGKYMHEWCGLSAEVIQNTSIYFFSYHNSDSEVEPLSYGHGLRLKDTRDAAVIRMLGEHGELGIEVSIGEEVIDQYQERKAELMEYISLLGTREEDKRARLDQIKPLWPLRTEELATLNYSDGSKLVEEILAERARDTLLKEIMSAVQLIGDYRESIKIGKRIEKLKKWKNILLDHLAPAFSFYLLYTYIQDSFSAEERIALAAATGASFIGGTVLDELRGNLERDKSRLINQVGSNYNWNKRNTPDWTWSRDNKEWLNIIKVTPRPQVQQDTAQ